MATCWIAEAYWGREPRPQHTLTARTRDDLQDWIRKYGAEGFRVEVRQASGAECAGVGKRPSVAE